MRSAWSSTANQQDAPDFIREVMGTERCDQYFNLSKFRQGFVNIITKEGVQRILEYKCTEQDKQRARYAMRHYDHYTEKKIAQTLSWSNWFGHNIVDRYDRLVGFSGFLGVTTELKKLPCKTPFTPEQTTN